MHNGTAGSRDEMVDRVYKDMYFGNGKPGMTTRMASAEDKLSAITKMFWVLVTLMLTLIGTTIAGDLKSHDAPQPHSYNDFR